ncbi:hypothetical protein EWG81_12825, partial [Salmonella enterica subsp. enterica serovar Muenchen]|nr:hypothetical protein [Salmonella enterica subsp. enterica serovar Muenchen]EAM3262772.1 hypothetical protein [Salmonella enterica]EAA5586979.1 hypothetical protein [Salmonella enterica subsp. enterica serovar Muenchen]EAA6566974.1 hypothetical protein [Salmonella enterica subsp. enterica serovar Muenchen]EAA7142724.1 hypothetical protein [Salmonella enterica subsp. enterica serovar Muenchen]
GEHSPEEEKSAGSRFERCAATARRVAGRTPAIKCQASNKVKEPLRQDGLFCVCGNCKSVGLISAAPSGNRHRRMAAPPYSAYRNYPAYELVLL